jgi:hypothetical protein
VENGGYVHGRGQSNEHDSGANAREHERKMCVVVPHLLPKGGSGAAPLLDTPAIVTRFMTESEGVFDHPLSRQRLAVGSRAKETSLSLASHRPRALAPLDPRGRRANVAFRTFGIRGGRTTPTCQGSDGCPRRNASRRDQQIIPVPSPNIIHPRPCKNLVSCHPMTGWWGARTATGSRRTWESCI